jgi:UDP:flavonoid glycosyltransferase YjiC (YdhE family)
LGDGERKRIVAVTQGTIRPDQSELHLPTLQALSSRDDVLTIGILGKRGASLSENTVVPINARIADFVPYDAILPFCDVFVTNGGYGSFQHAVSHGIPIVVAGDTEEKIEISARIAWCRVGST